MRAKRVLPVDIPSVAFKGANHTDAKVFRQAATNLDNGYDVGGGNTKAAIATLLRNVAAVLDLNNQPDPAWSFYEFQQKQSATQPERTN